MTEQLVRRVHRLGDRRAGPSPAPRIRDCIAPRSTAPSRTALLFLREAQRSDGGYPGLWGINFTYAIFHAVRGLPPCGVPADDPVPPEPPDG